MPVQDEGSDSLALDEPFQTGATTSPGSEWDGQETEPGPVTPTVEETTQAATTDDEGQLPDEFDPKFREPFNGLLFIGALTYSFTLLGHRFKIKTVGIDDLLEVGLITAKYKGTLGESRAYSTAMVAASLMSVDGKQLPQPLTMDPDDTALANAYEYIRGHYFPPIVDALYLKYLELEAQVEQIIAAMGKASG